MMPTDGYYQVYQELEKNTAYLLYHVYRDVVSFSYKIGNCIWYYYTELYSNVFIETIEHPRLWKRQFMIDTII